MYKSEFHSQITGFVFGKCDCFAVCVRMHNVSYTHALFESIIQKFSGEHGSPLPTKMLNFNQRLNKKHDLIGANSSQSCCTRRKSSSSRTSLQVLVSLSSDLKSLEIFSRTLHFHFQHVFNFYSWIKLRIMSTWNTGKRIWMKIVTK